MHPSVQSEFMAFITRFEGRVDHMYLDILGLVTVGIGNLIDPISLALPLPFVFRNDPSVFASQEEITNQWNRIKAGGDALAQAGHTAAFHLTNLILTEPDIDALVVNKLFQNEATLKSSTPEFASFDLWPADAQLGLLSMAWAMGAAFATHGQWPNFRAACADQDWLAAAAHCNTKNSTRNRNAVNRGLFRNAAWAASEGQDPSQLFIPIPGNRPVLRLNATDQDHEGQGFDDDTSVSTLQWFLQWLGFYGGELNGVFDEVTDQAVHDFQQSEHELTLTSGGFSVDGVVGPTTWAALGYVVPLA